MKLYQFESAPNGRRVDLFIKAKGIELETHTLDMRGGEHFSAEYRTVNPLGTIPALCLEDGTVLAQVPAIVEYLEGLYPEPPLLGSGTLECALVRDWSHRLFIEGFLAVADVLRNSSKGFVNRALPGPEDYEQIPALVDRGRKRLPVFFRVLDSHLAGREFIVGDSYSFADIDAFVVCWFAGWIKETIPEDCQHLQSWYEAASVRADSQ